MCWIAECEICYVPMVVWRHHGTEPPAEHFHHMHEQLARVAAEQLTVEHYVDDNMRNIPDHYHAHARPAGDSSAMGSGRTPVPDPDRFDPLSRTDTGRPARRRKHLGRDRSRRCARCVARPGPGPLGACAVAAPGTAAGSPGAPRVLGIDGEGREVVEYIPGEVPWPAAHRRLLGSVETGGPDGSLFYAPFTTRSPTSIPARMPSGNSRRWPRTPWPTPTNGA